MLGREKVRGDDDYNDNETTCSDKFIKLFVISFYIDTKDFNNIY